MDSMEFVEDFKRYKEHLIKNGIPAELLTVFDDGISLDELTITIRLPRMLIASCDAMMQSDPNAPTLASLIEESCLNHMMLNTPGSSSAIAMWYIVEQKKKKKKPTVEEVDD
jgi:hypothetical protein